MYSLFKYYSSPIDMTHLVTRLYMYELVVQLSLIFVNEIRSTTSFSFSDLSWFFEFVQFFEILFINNSCNSLSYKPLHVSTCGPNIVDFRQQNQEHVIFFLHFFTWFFRLSWAGPFSTFSTFYLEEVPRIWEGEGHRRSEITNPVNNDYRAPAYTMRAKLCSRSASRGIATLKT